MNGSPPYTTAWGWRRWGGICCVGVIVHAGLVYWFGGRVLPKEPSPAVNASLALAADAGAQGLSMNAPGLSDPTLYALPTMNGFSGGAWLHLEPRQPAVAPWTEPPQWLPIATNGLGEAFSLVQRSQRNPGSIVESLLQPRSTRADILLASEPTRTNSSVAIEGPLSRRTLAAPLRVPSLIHPDVLPQTTLHLKVDPDGRVESAILHESCGVKAFDERALQIAASARFLPARPGAERNALTWGKLSFRWHTLLPSPASSASTLLED